MQGRDCDNQDEGQLAWERLTVNKLYKKELELSKASNGIDIK